jgi:hypothetical protein
MGTGKSGMNESDKSLCQAAAKSLELKDITLFESRFERGDISEAEGTVQTKKAVRYSKTADTTEDGKSQSLKILVSLGIRVVDKESAAEENPELLFMIEADYLVEYRINDEITDDEAKAFAHFNGVHNVWPFWRQHVFTVTQQARLPHVEVPLFTG